MKDLKLWQKQYLSTLLLFMLAFYGCVFFWLITAFLRHFLQPRKQRPGNIP